MQELRHIHQFEADPLFAPRYVWRSVKHGHTDSPYEAGARAYVARSLAGAHPTA